MRNSCFRAAILLFATYSLTASAAATIRRSLEDQAELWVRSANNNQVLRYDANSGAFLGVAASGGRLNGPQNFAFGPDGNLYVASAFGSAVIKYDRYSGEYLETFVPEGSGGLNNAIGLTFGPDGNLYVGSWGNSTIKRYNGTNGVFLGDVVRNSENGFGGGNDLEFGPDGRLYVTSYRDRTVKRYDLSGTFVDSFVNASTNGVVNLVGLDFGPDNNLYVLDNRDGGSIQRYNGSTGVFMDTFIPGGRGGLLTPTMLEFGGNGFVYVTDSAVDGIRRYNAATGAYVDLFILPGRGGLSGAGWMLYVTNRSPTLPVITAQPISQRRPAGTAVQFAVIAHGQGPLYYQWRFNGTNLLGATNALLTLTNLSLSASGDYSVLVTNALWSLASQSAVLTVFAPLPLAESLDATDLVWNSGGASRWFGQTFTSSDGIDAGQSGAITNGQTSWMETTVTGPGFITFRWRTSSEANRDFLNFYIGGVLQTNISGISGWSEQLHRLLPGNQTLRWEYRKDAIVSIGSDAKWVDQVRFAPPVANDDFARIILVGATVLTNVSNVGASKQLGEPDHAGEPPLRSVWWTWTAPADGKYVIHTEGSDIDTLLAVYTGSSLSNLTEIASNDDTAEDFTSAVIFAAIAETSYHVAVDGYDGEMGNIRLQLRPALSPPNDDFVDRIVLTGAVVRVLGSNVDASKERGESFHAADPGGHSVWWSWTTPRTGIFSISTEGSSFDTLLAVYTGNSLSNLTLIGSNDQGGVDDTSVVTIRAQEGTTYQIAVDGWDGESGEIVLNIDAPKLIRPGFVNVGEFNFRFTSFTGLTYSVEASTNLVNWIPIGPNVATNTLARAVDPAASMFRYRFYRLRLLP